MRSSARNSRSDLVPFLRNISLVFHPNTIAWPWHLKTEIKTNADITDIASKDKAQIKRRFKNF